LQNKGREPFSLTKAQSDEFKLFGMTEADVKKDADSVYPTSGFRSLTGTNGIMETSNAFASTHKSQAAIIVWDGNVGNGDTYKTTGPKMASLIDKLVPGLPTGQPKLVKYSNSAEGAVDSNSEGEYHGKVIVSYDSSTGAYEVWMAGASLKEPVLSLTSTNVRNLLGAGFDVESLSCRLLPVTCSLYLGWLNRKETLGIHLTRIYAYVLAHMQPTNLAIISYQILRSSLPH
jgi:hypothetical protein